MRAWCGLILALLVGCGPLVPATVPPQLSHTPGTFVTISADQISTDAYRLSYPLGWRVVKLNTAAQPPAFVIASPDDAVQIAIGDQAAEALRPSEGTISLEAERVLPTGRLSVRLIAPPERQAEAEAHLRRLLDSLRPP
ncbi:MAG: hypothetical protein NZ750_06060 [Anaerolineae bacterium]|nr:hypothetical protein [Anaerolineae bacterium]MDW8173012.1 hypothetical protein [Anaerolineae bacterium]